MNERIKEIARHAGYQEDMFGVGHWDMSECQQFAELIIKECVDAAEEAQADFYVVHNIKSRFGLAELKNAQTN